MTPVCADLAVTDFFHLLADDTRLGLLQLLAARSELCVCELVSALGESQPKVSRHLALLRSAEVVSDRRQGAWVHYRLHPGLASWQRQVLALTLQEPVSQKALQERLARMQKARPGNCTA
jgi:ArsR family transcriptional regulator